MFPSQGKEDDARRGFSRGRDEDRASKLSTRATEAGLVGSDGGGVRRWSTVLEAMAWISTEHAVPSLGEL